VELDGFRWTLVDAGPTFDAFLGMDRIRFLLLDFIDFTRADLNAVSTTLAFVLINNRIHFANVRILNSEFLN
jgi:hypothetical protein